MIFLVEYNREKAKTLTFRSYPDSERTKAQDDRLELELKLLAEGVEHEVVILEAVDEAHVRRTHSRYFPDQTALFNELLDGVAAQYRAAGMASAPEPVAK